MIERKWGWKKDLPDPRDPKYRKPKGIVIPDHVDLRAGCSPVEDQADLGSCTSQALVGLLEFLENKDGVEFVDFSRLMVYYLEREAEGTIDEDGGAMLRTGVKILHQFGTCHETTWPYDITKFKVRPSQQAYIEAEQHRITVYEKMYSLEDILTCLASGFPVAFGFAVFECMKSEEMIRTGMLRMPEPDEQMLGGHAVYAVGYDLPKRLFIVRNSWGKEFGDEGCFYMPFGYFEEGYCDDYWTIRKGTGM
jgi:C1A family cysteine protease